MSEYLPTVVITQTSARHHPRHSLGLEEDLGEVDHGHLESLIARNLRLSLEEALEMIKSLINSKSIKFTPYVNFSSKFFESFL